MSFLARLIKIDLSTFGRTRWISYKDLDRILSYLAQHHGLKGYP